MPSVEETSVDNSRTEEAKDSKKEKPVLHTTLVDAQPLYAGMAGQCLFDSCDCRFFIGTAGSCSACSHPNLYHLVKPNREDVQTRQLEADRQKQLFLKRKQRQQREQLDRQRAEAAALPSGAVANSCPCSVAGCDCGRFVAPAAAVAAAVAGGGEDAAGGVTGRLEVGGGGQAGSVSPSPKVGAAMGADGAGGGGGLLSPSSSGGGGGVVDSKAHLLPRVCRKCKHADMYHVKRADDEDKKKGAKGKAPAKKK